VRAHTNIHAHMGSSHLHTHTQHNTTHTHTHTHTHTPGTKNRLGAPSFHVELSSENTFYIRRTYSIIREHNLY